MVGLFLIIIISLGAVSASDNQTMDCIGNPFVLNDFDYVSNAIDSSPINEIDESNVSANASTEDDFEDSYVGSYRFSCENDVIYETVYPWNLENPSDLNGNAIYIEQSNPLYNLTGNVTFYFDGEIVGDDMISKYPVAFTGYSYEYNYHLGNHTINLIYSGDDHYRPVNKTFNYVYSKFYSKILESNNLYVRLANYMTGTFTVKITQSGSKNVIVKKMSVIGSKIYDFEGYERVRYCGHYIALQELKKGKTYNVEVTFHGGKSKPYTTFKVMNQTFKATGNYRYVVSVCNDAIKAKYGSDVSLRINVNGKKIAKNQVVTIKIAKNTFKAKAYKNGYVKFTLPNTIGVAKHSIDVTYKGVKVSKKITVKHLLSLKTVNVKKSAKKLVLQATLGKVSGKCLKNKKITFKFNGKKYTAKTNNKGVAKITVESKVLKKLKVGKDVAYQAAYLKDSVVKTSKVKK